MTYFQYSDLQKNRVENWASLETSSLLNQGTIDPDAKVMPCGHIAGAVLSSSILLNLSRCAKFSL